MSNVSVPQDECCDQNDQIREAELNQFYVNDQYLFGFEYRHL